MKVPLTRRPAGFRGVFAVVLLCAAAGEAWADLPGGLANGVDLKQGAANSKSLASAGIEERLFVNAVDALEAGRIDDAQGHLQELVAHRPDFRLAQLVYADLLTARTGPLARFGSLETAHENLEALKDEARRRLARFRDGPEGERLPDNLILPSDDQKHVIVVDTRASRLYLFANDNGRLQRRYDYYVSSGKNGPFKLREGDQKTPVGVYFITGWISPAKLPDFFGVGALPVNYPNEWDLRRGRTGYGIWIHGVPSDTYSRTPQASDGCLALANSDLETVGRLVTDAEVPVLISDGIHWVERGLMDGRRREVKAILDAWRRDWESLDFERYSENYSKDFVSEDKTRAEWLRYKRRINAAKTFIRVNLANVSTFGYPGEAEMLVVTFEQDYRSSNFQDRTKKRQYWRREADGRWRILFEGEAKFQKIHYRGMPYAVRANLTRLTPPR
jgi:murein L,D-transpeptidase YafK